MSHSRYREERTLTRRLCRLPGEDHAEFKLKIARLREHFERFNLDTSELCQWLMGLRKQYQSVNSENPGSFGTLGDFILKPDMEGLEVDEKESDRLRLIVFDYVAGFRTSLTRLKHPLPDSLQDAARKTADHPKTPTTEKLLNRMKGYEKPHRLVLLKAAAEWIVARYQRGIENWERQHQEWEKENTRWEQQHQALTEKIRTQFTDVFKSLKDPDENNSSGIRRKRPRICPIKRISENKDNCIFAGEKGHGPLCWKYTEFIRAQKGQNQKFNPKGFEKDASRFIELCKKLGAQSDKIFQSPYVQKNLFENENPHSLSRFRKNWNAYLESMNLNFTTVTQHGRLPHCLKIGETFEKSQCQWNPHTQLCNLYRDKLASFDLETLKLEPEYREWRRHYLAGPRKPSFQYPSSRKLPMPKIFGEGFHEIDLDCSILRLRLDNMHEGEWIEFGFIPWPSYYTPSRKDVEISSVHVNFLGTRARVGFRFEVPHKQSRFACKQDELDELRSRKFPRQAHDQQFLDTARQRLLETFSENNNLDLRLLAVDLGEKGAHAAVYQGVNHQKDIPLEIVKIDQQYAGIPEVLEMDKEKQPPVKFKPNEDSRGLRKEHVGRHLETIAEGAVRLSAHRPAGKTDSGTLHDHDFRGLTRHIRWMIRDWAQHNAAQVVAAAEQNNCDLIVFESFRGFKPPGYDKLDSEKKKRMAMFAYGRIRHKVVEKAVERGLRVVTVPYFKSSQFCSACGHEQQDKGRLKHNKKTHNFKCECADPKAKRKDAKPDCRCNFKLDSDANAARILARVFWGEIILPSPEEKSIP